MANSLGTILKSDKFLLYSSIVSSFIAGGAAVFFLTKNQVDYYRAANVDLQTKYEINEKTNLTKCDNEKAELRISIKNTMLEQYQKFDKNSKESQLYLETIDLLNAKSK
jgi:hypothetical protein